MNALNVTEDDVMKMMKLFKQYFSLFFKIASEKNRKVPFRSVEKKIIDHAPSKHICTSNKQTVEFIDAGI